MNIQANEISRDIYDFSWRMTKTEDFRKYAIGSTNYHAAAHILYSDNSTKIIHRELTRTIENNL